MTLNLATLASGARTVMEWSVADATASQLGDIWGVQSPSVYGSGVGGIPFDTGTGAAGGDNPTSYTYQGRTMHALAADASIVRMEQGGDAWHTATAFWDLLWMSPIVTANATVGSGTLPARDAFGGSDGYEVALFGFITSGSGGVTVTASYTNTAGTSGRTATIPFSTVAGMRRATLDSGDVGVKSIESLTTNSATNLRLILARRLAMHRVAYRTYDNRLFGRPESGCLMAASVIKSGALIFPTYHVNGVGTPRAAYTRLELVNV